MEHDKGAACAHASPHTESPVHILSPQDKESLTFTTSERVVLTCELSRVDFPARWYKDGQEVEEGESLVVKIDGRKHRLILPAAEVRDSGEFECRTEGVSAFFSVTVRGQQLWWSGLLRLRLIPRGHAGPAPWAACLGVPSRESQGGQRTRFQMTLYLLPNPPVHQHPPAYLPCTYPWLGNEGGETKFH